MEVAAHVHPFAAGLRHPPQRFFDERGTMNVTRIRKSVFGYIKRHVVARSVFEHVVDT